MKKIISTTIFLLLTRVALYCQQIPQQTQQISNHDLAMQYLNKSKSQKKTSTILLVSGCTLTVAGLIVGLSGFSNGFDFRHPGKGSSAMNVGNALAITGAGVVAAGIPFALLAKHNNKKAELLLRDDKMPAAPTTFTRGRIYSIGIKLSL